MKGLLVRVGVDSTSGYWNAPVNSRTGRFAYVPIPEEEESRRGYGRPYSECVLALARFKTALPPNLKRMDMHLDPDFEMLTYGDVHPRNLPILKLGRGDILAFYAGLKPIQPPSNRLAYALIGVFVIDEVVDATKIPRDRWHENAHTRRKWLDTDIVVRAMPCKSGRLEQCIPIGEYRDRSYRVRKDLLKAWGGLSVKDGFLQRSGRLPSFTDADRFYAWFQRQKPELVKKNN
jgi:hypothetical protein